MRPSLGLEGPQTLPVGTVGLGEALARQGLGIGRADSDREGFWLQQLFAPAANVFLVLEDESGFPSPRPFFLPPGNGEGGDALQGETFPSGPPCLS